MRQLLTILILSAGLSHAADVPPIVHFQAILRDAAGVPINGTVDADPYIFTSATGGSPVHAGFFPPIEVVDGLLTIPIGDPSVSVLLTQFEFVVNEYPELWLELRIDGEVLSPRIPIRSAPYAINAGTLEGRPPADFLDTSATEQVKEGRLTVTDAVWADSVIVTGPGITVGRDAIERNQGINFFEDGVVGGEALVWLDGPDRFRLSDTLGLEGSLLIEGTDEDGAALSLTRFGSSPRTLDLDTFDRFRFDNDIVLPSAGALAFDGGPQIASNGLSLEVSSSLESSSTLTGSILRSGSHINVNHDGPDGNGTLYFYEGGSQFGESIYWNNSEGRFQMTDGLRLQGGFEVESTSMRINVDGPDGDSTLYFYDSGSSTGERLRWENTADRFLLSDDLVVDGNLSATGAKPFVQNHPTDDGLSVVYVALEGDEAGVYTRGSAIVERGIARVPLGESFRLVANPEVGLTAHLTPHADALLWIESISTTEIVVRSSSESPIPFDYLVQGLRIGYEEFATLAPRQIDARLPSRARRDVPFAARPELREATALARFRAMPGHARSAGEARSLREAIGEGETEIVDTPTEAEAGAPEAPPVAVEPSASELRASMAILLDAREPLAPGTVVAFDRDGSGSIVRADNTSGPRVAGVVVAREHAVLQAGGTRGGLAVAFDGIVEVEADGPILPGDLLVASPHAGRAMRDGDPLPGEVIGKAVSALAGGAGRVRVLLGGR